MFWHSKVFMEGTGYQSFVENFKLGKLENQPHRMVGVFDGDDVGSLYFITFGEKEVFLHKPGARERYTPEDAIGNHKWETFS